MFTGLVEDIGTLRAATRDLPKSGRRLGVAARLFDEPVRLGDSICIDGVCLTAVSWHPGVAEFDVGPETLSVTTLSTCRPGQRVNLERALRLSDRLGGHLVAGHVDGIGRISRAAARGEAWDVALFVPPPLLRYIVHKGSIAVDGISLTVNQVGAQGFEVSLVPHSQHQTTLSGKGVGDGVNLEVDLIGKYVERLLSGHLPGRDDRGLTLDQLKEHGFAPTE